MPTPCIANCQVSRPTEWLPAALLCRLPSLLSIVQVRGGYCFIRLNDVQLLTRDDGPGSAQALHHPSHRSSTQYRQMLLRFTTYPSHAINSKQNKRGKKILDRVPSAGHLLILYIHTIGSRLVHVLLLGPTFDMWPRRNHHTRRLGLVQPS